MLQSRCFREREAPGFTLGTVSLLPLDAHRTGRLGGGERQDERRDSSVGTRARTEHGSAADQKLATWLKTQPAEVVFARTIRRIPARLDDQPGEKKDREVEDLIHHCEEIADAVVGCGRSRRKRALLGQIEAALKSTVRSAAGAQGKKAGTIASRHVSQSGL